MDNFIKVIPLFVILIICVFNGFSMCSYRVSNKRAYGYFAAVTVFCLILNSYIVIFYGNSALQSLMLFTIGLPYFFLILLITKDKISQTFFNFWLWINIYTIITNLSLFINDYTLRNRPFMISLRFLLFCAYFVIYNRYLKAGHQYIKETLKINWWVFSLIPMFFTILLHLTNHYFQDFYGLSRNYPVLLTIYTLMFLVYALFIYIFRTVHDSMEKEWFVQNMKEQINLQKKQYEYYLQLEEKERIFRHDQRFRDTILLKFLELGETENAKEFLQKELDEIQKNTIVPLCENHLINAVLTDYQTKALEKGLAFSISIQLPEKMSFDDAEFCVLLSNLLENSLDAAKSYIKVQVKPTNGQIYLNIKNDYNGQALKDDTGQYISTKQHGSGLGLKSVDIILKNYEGFLEIDDQNGVFDVYARLKN